MKKAVLIGITTGLIVIGMVSTLTSVKDASAQVYPSGMVAYWKLDETSGTNAADAFGRNNGILVNGPVWTSGIVGNALSFDGVDDYVNIPNSAGIAPGSFSIEAWVTADVNNKFQGIASTHYKDVLPNQWALGTQWDAPYNKFRFWLGTSTGSGIVIDSITQIITGTWYHVVATWDDSTRTGRLYVNGILENNATAVSGSFQGSYRPLVIGDFENLLRLWDGTIDEVAVYNRALSLEEIQRHYQNGLSGYGYPICPCEELTARLDKIEAELSIKNQEIDELKSWRQTIESWKITIDEFAEWTKVQISDIWTKLTQLQEEVTTEVAAIWQWLEDHIPPGLWQAIPGSRR